jgi:tetratricopeptide (TPR) repeat protein
LLVVLGLAALTCVAYGRSLGNDFIDLDDPEYVTGNEHVTGGPTRANLVWACTAFHANNWHPLTWVSLQLDALLFGTHAWGYHLTNLLLHLLATLLLFGVLRYLTGAVWRGALVAALFAVHPLHVESVAWVSERKDVLSAVFWMLTLWAYAWYTRRPSPVRYLVVAAVFAIGLTAKPTLVTLPCVLLLLDYWPLCRTRWLPGSSVVVSVRRLIAEKLPLLALAVGVSVLTVGAQQHIVRTMEEMPLGVRVQNAVVTCVTYLGQMFWPVDLAVFYPHPGTRMPLWKPAAAAALLIGVSLLAVVGARRRPYLAVGWFWYLGTLVPVVGLVQVGVHGHADRYTYLPLVGVLLALVWAAAEVAARWRLPWQPLAAGALTVLVLCVGLTVAQVGYWKDSVTLWQHAVDVTDSAMAHYCLGAAQVESGEQRRQWDAAEVHLTRALQLQPGFRPAVQALAVLYRRRGRPADAGRVFAHALESDPTWAEGHEKLGGLLLHTGHPERAARQFEEALGLKPDLVEARYNLALALVALGRFDEAAEQCRQAKASDPAWPAAYRRLVWALATGGHGDVEGAGNLAVRLMHEVEAATLARSPEVLDALAVSYAMAGRYDVAVRTAREAVTAAEAQAPETLPALRGRLECYERHELPRGGESPGVGP